MLRATHVLVAFVSVRAEPSAGSCTDDLQRLTANLRPSPSSQAGCTGPIECQRAYPLELVNCSAKERAPKHRDEAMHERAKLACNTSAMSLDTGGWCLRTPTRHTKRCVNPFGPKAHGCFASVPAQGNGTSRTYFLPGHHCVPDGRLVNLMDHLLTRARAPGHRTSLLDFGAGVGQMCSALLARDSRRECRSYDGAGNVESTTGGFVEWFDLSTPLRLPRADWVLSLEVGEHVPNALEPMMIRNLVAHACRGIVLSWGMYKPRDIGHHDANYHSKVYLTSVLEQLGFRHDANLTRAVLDDRATPRHRWFKNTLVGVFERWKPLEDCIGAHRE